MSNIAVINLAGAQQLVRPGTKFEVNMLDIEAGKTFAPEVLLSTENGNVLFNEGKVEAKLVEHKKGEKLYIIKFKAKSRYRRRTGHRQHLSLVEIVSINGEKAEAKSSKVVNTEVSEETVKPKKATVKKATKTKAKKTEK